MSFRWDYKRIYNGVQLKRGEITHDKKSIFKILSCSILVVICLSACSESNNQSVQNTKQSTVVPTADNTTKESEQPQPPSNLRYEQKSYLNFSAFPNELDMLVDSKQPLTKFTAKILDYTKKDNECNLTIDKVEEGSENDDPTKGPLYTNSKEEKEQIKVSNECLVFLQDFTQCKVPELGENLGKEIYQNAADEDGTPSAVYNFYTYGDPVLLMVSISTKESEPSTSALEYEQKSYTNFYAFPDALDKLVDSKQPLTEFTAKILDYTEKDNECIFTIDKVKEGSESDDPTKGPLYTNSKEEMEQIKVSKECLVFLQDFTQCKAPEFGKNLGKEIYQNVPEEDGTSSAVYNFYTYGDTVLLMFSIYIP